MGIEFILIRYVSKYTFKNLKPNIEFLLIEYNITHCHVLILFSFKKYRFHRSGVGK